MRSRRVISKSSSSVALPPGPTAVIFAGADQKTKGVPVISPVEAEIETPFGNPFADQLVIGRLVVSTGVGLNERKAVAMPATDSPSVSFGTPAEMASVIICVEEPPEPVAVRIKVEIPMEAASPVSWPVALSSTAQSGRPVADHKATGLL